MVQRVAIIGQGRSGRDIHAYSLGKMPDKYQVVAVVDLLEERRIRAKEELGCDVYADYRELFQRDDIDLIINASYSHMHVPITLDCLNHGYHVLCEKPLARRAAEVDTLIAAAQENDKILAIFQQSRYAPAFRKLREVIDSGVLGRIVQISIAYNGFARRWDWQTLQEYNGGNLLNTGPHPVDQALQLFGTDIMPQVTCIMDRANTFGDAEDYVKLLLHGHGRPTIDVEISSCCAYPSFTYNVQGTYGGLKGTTTHLEWKYYLPSEAPEQRLIREPISKPDGTPAYCREELILHEDCWDVPQEQQRDLFHTMAQSFYEMLYKTLTENVPLEITPQEVRQQIAVMEECHRQNPLPIL
ncbi:MAG: Gfo/Idh/MocA family oxidoreductase [Firmicutes bacterium]|nr:Gfo/Idh/MocA family oxidoreductase [Bacillota bacterium]